MHWIHQLSRLQFIQNDFPSSCRFYFSWLFECLEMSYFVTNTVGHMAWTAGFPGTLSKNAQLPWHGIKLLAAVFSSRDSLWSLMKMGPEQMSTVKENSFLNVLCIPGLSHSGWRCEHWSSLGWPLAQSWVTSGPVSSSYFLSLEKFHLNKDKPILEKTPL